MTTIDLDAYATRPAADAEIKRDQYGRYLLPDPVTSEQRSWQRTTTFIKLLADTYNIDRWRLRQAARGLAIRPDLIALIGAVPDPTTRDAKKEIGTAVDTAIEAAGASSGANWGTAIHAITESIDRGETPAHVPDVVKPKLDAYQQAVTDAGLTFRPEWIERVIVNTTLEVGGMIDRFAQLTDGTVIGADLKTGRTVDFGHLEFCMQIAAYVGADGLYNGTGYDPMPDNLNTEWGLLIHLPSTPGDDRCELHVVDLVAGHRANLVAVDVRKLRRRRGLLQPMTTTPATPEGTDLSGPTARPVQTLSPPADPDRRTELLRRCRRLQGAALTRMKQAWPNVPPLTGDHPHTDDELDRIETVLATVTGDHVPDVRVDEITERLQALPNDLYALVDADAQQQGIPNLANGLNQSDAHWLELRTAAAEAEALTRFRARVDALAALTEEQIEIICFLVGVDRGDVGWSKLSDPSHTHIMALTAGHTDDSVLEQAGNKRALLKTGRTVAKQHNLPAPSSSTDVLNDPLLTALTGQHLERETDAT